MLVQAHAVPPVLRPYVSVLWTMDESNNRLAANRSPMLILPDGAVEIVVHRGDPWLEQARGADEKRQPRAFVTSQMCGPLSIRSNGVVSFVAARCSARGAYQLFGARMYHLSNATTELEAVWKGVPRLEDEVQAAPRPQLRAKALEHHLMAQLALNGCSDPLVDGAIAHIIHERGKVRVAELATSIGSGERKLNRRFNDRVGLSPKAFASIVRFKTAAHAIKEGKGQDLLDLALRAGYYDLSHMDRDFRKFAGLEPSAFEAADDIYF